MYKRLRSLQAVLAGAPSRQKRQTFGRVAWALSAVLLCAAFLLPLVFMATGAFRVPHQPPPRGFELLPRPAGFLAFVQAFTFVPMARALLNSATICFIAVPLTVLTSSLAGLALAFATGRARTLFFSTLVLLLMVPTTALWIPRFVMFEALGLFGTYVPLIAPGLIGGSPLFVLLYMIAIRRLSPELFEAARLEGASAFAVWWKVVMPLIRPTTTAVALLAFVAFWSNFIDPLLYLSREESLTATLMLHSLDLYGPTNWPVVLAGALTITLPPLLMFLAAHRFFAAAERGTGWLGR